MIRFSVNGRDMEFYPEDRETFDFRPVNVRFQINDLPILIDKDGREIRAFRIDGMN